MVKLPEFDFRLQRSDDQPPEFSVEFAVHDGGLGVLRAARPGSSARVAPATMGEARRLSASQLTASRFDLTWESGARRISYGLFELVGDELDHLVSGTWYSLRAERRDGPRRLELARASGTFGLAQLEPKPEAEPDTDERPNELSGAVEVANPLVIDTTADGPPHVSSTHQMAPSDALVGPTGGALVRHLRRRQARDAREIARLRTELKRLHALLKDNGLSP